MVSWQKVVAASKSFSRDWWGAYWALIKILIPAMVVVKILELFGAIDSLGLLLGPLMNPLGLSSELGLVWAAAMLTNIYGAMVVFYELSSGAGYSVAEVSTLGILVLLSHALPVEGSVAKALGAPWRLTLLLRIGGAYCLAWLTHGVYQLLGASQQRAVSVWAPDYSESGMLNWLIEQTQVLLSIFIILGSLMALLRFIRFIGVERALHFVLRPLMNLLQVRKEAANITIIGLLLGLSFGAGLLLNESRSNRVSKRDMAVVVCFLGLCHSLVEDTILIMLLGADIYAVLIGRIIFSCVLMVLVVATLYKAPGIKRL